MARGHLVLLFAISALAFSCGSGPNVSAYMSIDIGERKRVQFFTDTVNINCIAELTGAKDGITVFARVRRTRTLDGTPESLVFQVGEFPANHETKKLIFSLSHVGNPNLSSELNVEPWPPGSYACDVMIDGIVRASAPFEIKIPVCPVYPAQQGFRCRGFYPIGTECPAADQTKTCVCSAETGQWDCP